MRYVALGVGLVALGLAGMLVYVNYYSETARGPGDLVLDLAWTSLVGGAVVATFGVALVAVRRLR